MKKMFFFLLAASLFFIHSCASEPWDGEMEKPFGGSNGAIVKIVETTKYYTKDGDVDKKSTTERITTYDQDGHLIHREELDYYENKVFCVDRFYKDGAVYRVIKDSYSGYSYGLDECRYVERLELVLTKRNKNRMEFYGFHHDGSANYNLTKYEWIGTDTAKVFLLRDKDIIIEQISSIDDSPLGQIINCYDNLGNLTESKKINSDDEIEKTEVYTYDDQSNMTNYEVNYVNEDRKKVYTYKYLQFDEKWNWIECLNYVDGELYSSITRKIQYAQ